jgi:uncharacterized membrane protein
MDGPDRPPVTRLNPLPPPNTPTPTHTQNNKKQLTDIFYQIDLLLGPVLVIMITWTFTFLAVALAEKQVGG